MFHPYPDGQGVKMETLPGEAARVESVAGGVTSAPIETTAVASVPTTEPIVPVINSEPTTLVTVEAATTTTDEVSRMAEERGPSFTALFDSTTNGTTRETESLQEPPTTTTTTTTTTANEQPPIPTPAPPIPTIPTPAPTGTSLPLRTRSSCTNCRQRKQRCDHGPPGRPCRACEKGGKVCVYPGGIVLTAGGTAGVGGGAVHGGAEGRKSDSKKRPVAHPPRGNREFTDSEDDIFRASSSNTSPKRETRSTRTVPQKTSLLADADKSQVDEVDELDDEDDIGVEEEPRRVPKMMPPAPAPVQSSRYYSSTNGVDESRKSRTDIAFSEGEEDLTEESEEEANQQGGSRSSSEDPLQRSKSRERAPLSSHRNRGSDGLRQSATSGVLDRFMAGRETESPFAGKGKRKSTVTEGEVEGEILALVEEDQRPSKSKKSRRSSPRERSRSSVNHGPTYQADGMFSRPNDLARYGMDARGFPASTRSGYMGMINPAYQGTPAQIPTPNSAAQGVPLSALSAYGQHAIGGGFAGHGRPGSVPGAAGMVIGYPAGQGYLYPSPQQPGQQMPMQLPMQGMHVQPSNHSARPSIAAGYDLGMPSHLPTPAGMEYSARTSQESLATHPSLTSSYACSLASLLAVLPPLGTQQILYQTFFQDAFLAEGVTLLQAPFTDELRYLLHRRSTQQQQHNMGAPPMEPFKSGDATTLALAFAILASALRVLPEESSQLLLSSVDPHAYPRSLDRVIQGKPAGSNMGVPEDKTATPLHRRYMDHALLASTYAVTDDTPSIMQVCLKLVCYRYAKLCVREAGVNVTTGHVGKPRPREKNAAAGLSLVQAIKVAQAIKLHREREGVPTFDRELRRRVFYALYTADRLHAFETSAPYMIHDHHTSAHIPSAISDPDLYQHTTSGLSASLPHYDYKHSASPVVHLVVMAQIAKSMTPLLDTLAVYSASDISPEAVDRYDAAFQACEDDLPSYYHLSPATNTSFDQQEPYLLFHRLDTLSHLYGLRMSLYRAKLNTYLSIKTPHAARNKLAKLCYSTLRVQRSARILESKFAFRLFSVEKVFEAAFVLGFIARVELAYSAAERSQSQRPGPNTFASDESIEDMQQGLTEAIELLEGVTAWPEIGSFAIKTSKILRKVGKLLSASWNLESKKTESHSGDSVRAHPHVARVAAWLKSWRGMDIDTLTAEADYDDWNKVLRSMQA